jgi:hypothetical protein
MRGDWDLRRGLTLAAAAMLTTAALGTAACGSSAASADTYRASSMKSTVKTPGWRVVKMIGPAKSNVSSFLTADSANDAWSVWTGSGTALVEHWTGSAWKAVPLPAKFDAYVQTAVSIGASSPANAWLFGTHRTTEALRWTGATWVLQPIPSWVLPRDHAGTVTAMSAVFGPGDVWVFSLGIVGYAAHYNGHSWTRVRLSAVPAGVSALAADDIWVLGTGVVLHWNGKQWATIDLPAIPLPSGANLSYSDLTATGPGDAWVVRTITFRNELPATTLMHWNGKSWLTVDGPANNVGSIAPDGSGGLWADGIDVNPAGFWLLYHLVGGHWTEYTPPGVDTHSPTPLTRIPGTRSLWAVGSAFSPKGYYGVILKYGP